MLGWYVHAKGKFEIGDDTGKGKLTTRYDLTLDEVGKNSHCFVVDCV